MPDPIVLPRLSRVRGAAARSTTWWGRAFVRSFEELSVDANDLLAARALARTGRLGAIVVLDAMASAVVDPGSTEPLMAQIKVDRLDDAGWTTFAREAARESGHAAALEAAELPAELVEHADEAGAEVLPGPATSTPPASATPGRSRACTRWRCSTSSRGTPTVIPTSCCCCADAPASSSWPR